jgi:hypothetical protein
VKAYIQRDKFFLIVFVVAEYFISQPAKHRRKFDEPGSVKENVHIFAVQ